jgi:hypothetical protein
MTNNPPHFDVIDRLIANSDFQSLMGADWYKLHSDIQARFSLAHCHRAISYCGTMSEVKMSFVGRLLANFCRLIGTPLSYGAGKNVPTEVKVYPNKTLGGMVWDRYYRFSESKVNRVRSTKIILPNRRLIEISISGFGMYSKVYAKDGAIVFESQRFFCTLGRWRMPIPHVLSPGKTTATQRALSDGRFEFTLDIRHNLFGQVFKQVGIFREVTDSSNDKFIAA